MCGLRSTLNRPCRDSLTKTLYQKRYVRGEIQVEVLFSAPKEFLQSFGGSLELKNRNDSSERRAT